MSTPNPRILFLNQYFPPDHAPTGVLMKEIAEDLAAHGFQCSFVSAAEAYRAPNKTGKRMIRELSALWKILMEGMRAQKPDLVISGSSPPCLAVVAALVARVHGAKSVHWAMDVYPDLAVELGEIRPGLLLTAITKAMNWAYDNSHLVIVLDEDMRRRFEAISTGMIRPWLPASQGGSTEPQASEPTWIYSGNLGRAHEWETLLEAQSLLEKRGSPMRLVFQGGGASWDLAREKAGRLGLRQCEWRPYVDQEHLRASLLGARAIIVTQKIGTQGLLWPSKLALAMDLERPILWVGPKGAISALLGKSASAGIFEPGDATGIANWVESLTATATEKVCDAAAHREQALTAWRKVVFT